MARTIKTERLMELYEAILSLKDVDECRDFFEDLCSPMELSAMEQRYAVATLLSEDQSYLDILMKTKASTATISRVKRMMLHHGTGCIARVIERQKNADAPSPESQEDAGEEE